MNFFDHDYAPRGMDDEAFYEQERQAFSDWIAAEEEYDRMRQEQEREWEDKNEYYDPKSPIIFDGCSLHESDPTIDQVVGEIDKKNWFVHSIDLVPIRWSVGRGSYEIRCQGPMQPPAFGPVAKPARNWNDKDPSYFNSSGIPF